MTTHTGQGDSAFGKADPAGLAGDAAERDERAGGPQDALKERLQTVKDRTGELAGQARRSATAPENAPKVKGGGALLAGAAAVALLIWARRRYNARPKTRWERTLHTARSTGNRAADQAAHLGGRAADQASYLGALAADRAAALGGLATHRAAGLGGLAAEYGSRAGEYGGAVLDSDAAEYLRHQAKAVAAAPDTRPRAQGAAAALAGVAVMAVLRRAARRKGA